MTEQIARYQGMPPVTPGEHLRAIQREAGQLDSEDALCFNDLLNFKRRVERLCEHYQELTGGYKHG
jgi:hypothetical protein